VRSPLGQLQMEARLSVDAPACLDDHRILGEVVVSGPTQAALVMETWTHAMAHRAPVLRDLVFAHPLLLTPGIAGNVQIVLTPAGEHVSEFQIFSRPAGAAHSAETWSAHGRGRICEGATLAAEPIDIAAIERRCVTPLSAKTFYARMRARDIQLGATFRWLDAIQVGEAEAFGRLRDAGPQDAAARAFHFHPGRLDTFFQLLFAAIPHQDADRRAAMLLAVDEWRQSENDATPRYVHARLRHGNDADALVGDVTVFDRSGYALAEISGLHFLHVSREALRRTVAPLTPRTERPTAAPLQGTLAHDLATIPAGERRAALQARVETEVVQLLGGDIATPLDRMCGLFDLGLDSLTCIVLLNRLRTALGPAHSLPSTAVFDHPSIAALADHLLRTLEPDAATSVPAHHPSIAAAADEPIAIIGIGCRFPGGADGPEALWQLLRDGVDAIVDVPRARWDAEALYDPDPQARGKTSTRRGGFLGDVSGFDARFFGIAPREAESLDPQQRLLLEVAWEALEHAGLAPDRLKGTRSGVFVGTCFDDYARLRLNAGDLSAIDAYTGTGVERCFAAGRLAYVLGLQGPAMHVDTACSTSLVALHLACQSLRTGESDLALTGAANLILTPENTICFSRLSALAPDGRCKTFDAAADGYGRGEGCGVLVLKRLSTAVADGDRVLALVRGSAVNHDGASSGLTVPNGLAQQAVIRQALDHAGVSPHDVSYVEAHGTGTPLGDPIEIAALGAVLGAGRAENDRFLVGSVKTNLGHLEPAAGVAGVIKVVLSMLHGEIPAHLHFHTPNPLLLLDEAHAAVPTALTPWQPAGRRIAGVSSFGMSGTNAHVVLEEAPASETDESSPRSSERSSYLLPLSARTGSALDTVTSQFAAHLLRYPEQPLADICATAFSGRSHFSHRLAIVASSREELHRKLVDGEGVRGTTATGAPPRIAFLFTGQGAQWSGMGRQLFDGHPVFREVLERCDARLRNRLPRPLLSLIFDPDAAPLLDQTACTQPAIYALQVALAAVWRDAGVEPSMVLGHSIGELAAAHVAGLLDLEEGLDLAAERGRLMQSLTQPGAMVAVMASESRVRELLASFDMLSIAAVNGPQETVVSGDRDAVRALTGQLASSGVRTRSMRVSHAFHSALMDPILDDLEQHAGTVRFTPGRLPLISSRTGALVDVLGAHDMREHARQPVRFADGLRALDDAGCTIFIEVGPGTTLTGLGPQVLGESGRTFLPSLRKSRGDWQQLLETAGALYTRGVPLNLGAIDGPAVRRPVNLPTYPFERTRYWLAPSPAARQGAASTSSHSLLGRRIDTPLSSLIFESQLTASTPAFLGDHRLHGLALLPATAYFEMARHAATALGGRSPVIDAIALHRALVLDDEEPCTVQIVVTPKDHGAAIFEIASRTQVEAGSDTARQWTVHATGTLRLDADIEPLTAPLDIPALCGRLDAELDMSAYYERLHARGLEYGPAFRGIQALWRRPGEALGQVVLADALRAGTETFHAHPALLDAALQVLIAAIPGIDGEKRAYAPIGAERIRCDEALPEYLYSHGVLRSASGDPETLIGDVRIHDRDGRLLAIIEGLRVRRVTSDAIRPAAPDDEQVLHQVRWQRANAAPAPSSIADGRWMVFTDGSVLADAVIARLTAQHGRCDRVRAGERYEAIGSSEWTVDPAHPEQFERLLRDVASTAPLHGIVWLWGVDGTPLSPESLQHAESHGLRGLFHLSQALARGTARPLLALITRAASAIDDTSAAIDPMQAPMIGLLHALHLEHPDLPCVAIDLSAERMPDDADALVAALHRNDEPRIALRAGGAWIPRIIAARVPDSPPIALRADATYLITGGFGGLGAAVARWMAEHGAGHLVLLGRRAGATTDDTLAALTRGTNARAMARAVDVSQREPLAAVLDEIRDHLPPLAGIVHAAGVLDDGLLLNQRWEPCERVLAPKVRGALHLHQLTCNQPLDFFVMFSSMASLLGSRGQASYMAANAFLDALAHARRAEGLCGLSINWGPWADVGMADRMAHASTTRRGIRDLPPGQALDILGTLLAQTSGIAAQIGVIPIRWAEYLSSVPDGTASPFFDEMARGTPARPPAQGRRGELTRRLAEIPLEHRRTELIAHVHRTVAHALGLPAPETIEPAERLFALGLDSLMAVDVSQRLKIDVDRDLPATLLFDYPTVETLAGYLATEVYNLPTPPERIGTHRSPASSAADDLARTAAAIEDLGDDEVEALLLARLERTGERR
jgi:acyl transferase domain-containing protein/acyl carrier protein